MHRNIVPALSLFVCIISLLGCSSSSSDPTHTEPAGTFITGQFAASTVEGLDYQTLGRSNATDADGTFSYQSGETVTFAIGDLVLGETTGKAIVTILDLVPGATNMNNDRALNIARLLQSLDSDGNPRNGIQLTDQIKNELSAAPIDLDMPTEAFEIDPAVVALFERLNALQAFTDDQTGALRSAEEATAHFTQAYKDTWKAQWVEADTTGDGENDALVEYFYNADGRLILTERTFNGSEEPTIWVERREYDVNGYLILRQNEENGSIVYNEAYENDDRGNRTKRWYDNNRDGEWNIFEEFEYDANDNRIKLSYGESAGSFSYIYHWAYDGDGNLVSEERDIDADGTINLRYTYIYENGNLIRRDYDDNADGIIDRATHYTYDANGNLLTESYDHNNNGIFTDPNDWVQTYTYDANNLQKTRLTVSVNSGTSYAEFEYDDNGNKILEQSDGNYDGENPQWSFRQTWLYDSESRILNMAVDWDADGSIDEEMAFVYDDYGNVVESTIYSGDTLNRKHHLFWQQSVTPGYDTWFAPAGAEIFG
jgi:hypothetical protein